jgi:ArsR family transcriptional regulator
VRRKGETAGSGRAAHGHEILLAAVSTGEHTITVYSSPKVVTHPRAPRLGREALTLVASRFRALGEPLRLAMLQRLEAGECTVSDLASHVGTTQPNASKHLNVLEAAGLVRRERRGANVVCVLAGRWVFELCDTVCHSLGERLRAHAALLGAPASGPGRARRARAGR